MPTKAKPKQPASTGLDTLKANPKNPRKDWRDDAQHDAFRRSLAEFGDLSGVVFNVRTGCLVGGHKRVAELQADEGASKHVESRLAKPDAAGTVAYGHVVLSSGVRFAYREVSWTEPKEKAAMIAANRWSAEWDFPALNEMLAELAEMPALGFALDVTGFDGSFLNPEGEEGQEPDASAENGSGAATYDPENSAYSGKVSVPVYTPTGEKPPTRELANTSRMDGLLKDIARANIKDPEIVEFLNLAAHRHIAFDYGKIAEFYAHADKATQKLMEDSALVLVDFGRAVELGYVKLTERVKEMYARDYPDGYKGPEA